MAHPKTTISPHLYFANKGPSSQGYGFSSGHVWMWELDCEEGWAPNWCFWTVVLEKTLESPLDSKEIQPVHSEGDQSWVFFGRNDAKAETPVLWPPDAKSWLIGKESDAGRDWGQEEKGMTEDEMAGWHHQLDGRESKWTPGVGDGQGGLECCDSRGRKESDTTEQLNWAELMEAVAGRLYCKEFKNNFYWTIVDLQYCVSFRCTAKCVSYAYTYTYTYCLLRFSFHIGHFRVLSSIPCAIH